MTRKDHKVLAAALLAARPSYGNTKVERAFILQWEECVAQIALALQQDNPRFDRAKFNEACKGELQ